MGCDNILYLLEQLDNRLCNVPADLLQEVGYDDHHEKREEGERNDEDVPDVVADLCVHLINLVRNHLLRDDEHECIILAVVDVGLEEVG